MASVLEKLTKLSKLADESEKEPKFANRKERNLAKLKQILEVVDDSVTKDEFKEAFKVVLKSVLNLEKKLVEKINTLVVGMETKLDKKLSKLEKDSNISLTKDRDEIKKALSKSLKLQSDGLNFIHDKVRGLKNTNKKTDEKVVIVPAVPEEVTNTIQDLKEENEKQQEEIEELKLRPVGRGGGTSAMGVAQTFKYIAHTEEPVGAIDGANLTYTVKVDIWWIAGFTLNGENIAELPNYTFANKVITFSSAIPASFSGKDFEVKYIG